jgi:hypothetical protein
MTNTLPQRFWDKVDKTNTCWLWRGCASRKGYGGIQVNGKKLRANRVAFELTYGPIPDGLLVLHTCDVPTCVNPAHLYAGTHAQNMKDEVSRNRQAVQDGELGPNAKLTEAEVRCIYTDARSQHVLAKAFGVSVMTISFIKRGITWATVTGGHPGGRVS